MEKHSPQRNRLLKKSFSFTITPATTSETPYLLQPGKTVAFNIQVQNESAIADLIFLKCSELPEDWFTIQYVNSASEDAPGIVQLSEKLSLNPQETGEIQLTLHPPTDAAVGNYFPTLQLISMSAPDLVTLDVIYIQLLPDTHLDTRLIPESQTIANQPATFNFMVRNRGNVHRTFRVEAKDSGNLFRFDIANKTMSLAPGQEKTIALKAFPRSPRQRPLRGNPVRSNIAVTLIPEDALADLASRHSTQGKLLWLPYPKLVFALLMLMGMGAALFALGGLYRFNRAAIAPAEILSFNSTGQGNTVQLNWKLNNPETVGKAAVSQLNEGAEIQTVRYDFSNSIPEELKLQAGTNQGCRYVAAKNTSFALWQLPLPKLPWFYSLQQFPTPTSMECKNIPFDSKLSGSLRYKLKLFSKSNAHVPIAEYTTDAIVGQPNNSSQSSPQSASNWSNSSSPRILVFNVNGSPVQNQPTQTYSVRSGEVAEITVSWSVQGSTDVQLLPVPGSVGANGSVTYSLRAGDSKTITLTARNTSGESVTQSVAISAIGVAQSDRSPFRSGAPIPSQPASKPSSSPVEPTPPTSEDNQEIPQPSDPTPDANAPESDQSPTSSTSGTPTPDPAPTTTP